MSEPIPEAIPTSADPRSRRPLKKARRLPPTASALATQANAIDTLFLEPERPVVLPEVSKPKTSASLPAPPEIVANVQGSSAGPGSHHSVSVEPEPNGESIAVKKPLEVKVPTRSDEAVEGAEAAEGNSQEAGITIHDDD
ncbi:hypothetical protein DV738_g3031, partial [Chaetothyriales sp. CBS 135597]